LPSRFESFGIAFVEALYFGACLVGHTGMYAYDDICNAGQFGTYYNDNEPQSLAKAIEGAMEKTTEEDFTQECINFARKHFAWSKIVDDLIAKLKDA
jgi:glycosyltransferase involved in cell wall biosynthesis